MASDFFINDVDCDDLFEKGVVGVNSTDGGFNASGKTFYKHTSAYVLNGYTYYNDPNDSRLPVLQYNQENIGQIIKPWIYEKNHSNHINSNLARVSGFYNINEKSERLLCLRGRCPISGRMGYVMGLTEKNTFTAFTFCRRLDSDGNSKLYFKRSSPIKMGDAWSFPASPTIDDYSITLRDYEKNRSWYIVNVIGGGGCGSHGNTSLSGGAGGGAGGIARAIFKFPLDTTFYGLMGGGGSLDGSGGGITSCFGDYNFVYANPIGSAGQGIIAYGGRSGAFGGDNSNYRNSGGSASYREGVSCIYAAAQSGGYGGKGTGFNAREYGESRKFSWNLPPWGSEWTDVTSKGGSPSGSGSAIYWGGGGGGSWFNSRGGGGRGRSNGTFGSVHIEAEEGECGMIDIGY